MIRQSLRGIQLLSILVLLLNTFVITNTIAAAGPLSGRIIVLDPGHGGHDPGAIANGIEEKNITLPIALDAGALLTQAGAKVIYTRTSDVTVGPPDNITAGLAVRAQIANNAHANIFVSIHGNSLSDPNFSGVTSFYGQSSGYIDGVTRTPQVVDQSKLLATTVESAIVAATGAVNDGVHAADFYVLGNANMPAILVETGFLTNPIEARKLATPSYQEQIAAGIVEGIITFFQKVGNVTTQVFDPNSAQFITDVNFPDHSLVSPGQSFTKTWEVRNSGSTAWNSSFHLALEPGNTLQTQTVPLPSVPPGLTTQISVPVSVPTQPGTYTAAWRFTDPSGQPFGDPLWVVVTVPGSTIQSSWVETTSQTALRSNPDPDAQTLLLLAQWSFLQLTGPTDNGWLPVTEPTTGKEGYVEASLVGPSGPPPTSYQRPTPIPPFEPFWVQTIASQTPLYSGPSNPSITFGTVPQWSYLLVQAPQHSLRLYVLNPATNGTAYVNATDVGPSGPPPPSSPTATPSTTTSTVDTPADSAPPSNTAVTYTVKPGDTLWHIAQLYHMTLASLEQQIGWAPHSFIYPGQTLTFIPAKPVFTPFWVANFRVTHTWSGTNSAAIHFGLLPQFTTMLIIAPINNNRYLVKIWPSGNQAYVNASAVGPVGPPKGASW